MSKPQRKLGYEIYWHGMTGEHYTRYATQEECEAAIASITEHNKMFGYQPVAYNIRPAQVHRRKKRERDGVGR